MSVEIKVSGRASLIHVQTPDADLHKEEYFAKVRVDDGSMYGRERPLVLNFPLTREQYDELVAGMNSDSFRDLVGDAERYHVVPHIAVECDVRIDVRDGVV
jgi:hypothetical protein